MSNMNLGDGRRVEIPGIYNMRDVGGLPTSSGLTMQRGLFFRADNLGWLRPEGVDRLRTFGISTVIDLRMATETARHPNPFAEGDRPRYLNVDLVGKVVSPEDSHVKDPQWYRRELGDGAMEFPIYGRVREYCHWLENRPRQFHDILSTLMDTTAAPVVFHCAGGKDRTGVTAALLQALVGVADDAIAADYAHTADNNFERYSVADYRIDAIRTAADYRRQFCAPETMLLVLFWLRTRFGSVQGYLESIGLARTDVDGLKKRLNGHP